MSRHHRQAEFELLTRTLWIFDLEGFADPSLLRRGKGRHQLRDLRRQCSAPLPLGRQCPPGEKIRPQFGL